MSLSAGTVTITMSGETPGYSGSGLALALAQARFDSWIADVRTRVYGGTFPPDFIANVQVTANYFARDATVVASAIITYLTANSVVSLSGAHAHVTSQQLGKTTTAGNPIDAPASPVDVPITGGGTLS